MIEAILAAYITVQAPPQGECMPLETFILGAMSGFREIPFAHGVTAKGNRFIIVVNPKTGTWGMAEVMPNKTACVKYTGTGFVPFTPDSPLIPGKQADGT
jgi:hypothetical protein